MLSNDVSKLAGALRRGSGGLDRLGAVRQFVEGGGSALGLAVAVALACDGAELLGAVQADAVLTLTHLLNVAGGRPGERAWFAHMLREVQGWPGTEGGGK